MSESDELLDLVTADNKVVGTVLRKEHHANVEYYNSRGEYWRGVACFLLNSSGQLWIPRRQDNLDIAPSGLDFSMAEHVTSGEEHLQGAVRGMAEELTITAEESELHQVAEFIAFPIGCLMRIYMYRTDKDPTFDRRDYQSGQWLYPHEVSAMLDKPTEIKKYGLQKGVAAIEELIQSH